MNAKNRLMRYISHCGMSVRAFQRTASLPTTYVANMKSVTPKAADKISEAYPDLNIGWLLTGEGEMLRSTSPRPAIAEHAEALKQNQDGEEPRSGGTAAKIERGMNDTERAELIEQIKFLRSEIEKLHAIIERKDARMERKEAEAERKDIELARVHAKLHEMESALAQPLLAKDDSTQLSSAG